MGTAACSVKKTSSIIEDGRNALEGCCGCSEHVTSRLSMRDSRDAKIGAPDDVDANDSIPVTSRITRHSRSTLDAELVNQLLSFVWPKISEHIEGVLTQSIEPAIKQALGKYGTEFWFDRKRMSIGTMPSLENLNLRNEDIHSDRIRGEVHFDWEPDINVTSHFQCNYAGFQLPSQMQMSVSLSKMRLKGDLIFELVGLIPEPPFFKGVRFGFAELPEITVKFGGKAGRLFENAMKIDELQVQFEEELGNQFTLAAVVPHWKGVLLHPSADMFEIVTALPQGVLQVRVIEGRQLPGRDIGFFGKPLSDPYIKVSIAGTKWKSEVKYKTVNPKFDFSFDSLIRDSERQKVLLSVWDKDTLTLDDFLGKSELQVAEMTKWTDPQDVTLLDAKGNAGKNGFLKIRATWKPLVKFTHMLSEQPAEHMILFCGIYAAHSVPWFADISTFWIEAKRLYVGDKKVAEEDLFHKSPAVKRIRKLSNTGFTVRTMTDEAACQRLQQKLEMLQGQKHNLSEDEIAMLLDLDSNRFRLWRSQQSDGKLLRELVVTKRDDVVLNQAFTFFIQSREALVKLDLMSSSGDRAESLGSVEIPLASLIHMPPTSKVTRTELLLGKQNIRLSFCLQLYITTDA